MSDLDDGLDALKESRKGYDQAELYYDGAVPEVFASVRMRTLLARAGISYKVNFAQLPVKVMASRLRIAAVTASAPEAQPTLDRIWRRNRLQLVSRVIHRKVGMYGDGYLVVWPNAEGTDVDVRWNSPLTTRVVYDSEDDFAPAFAIKRWCLAGKVERANLYYPDRIERYLSEDGGKTWAAYTDPADGVAVVENTYGVLPVFHLRTDLPYGEPDHRNAYGIQDAINKLVTVQMGNVDFYGFPQRAALMSPQAATDEMDREDGWDDEQDLADRDPDDDDGTAATIQASPDRMLLLRGVQQLLQLPGADPQVFASPFLLFVRAMAQVCETPVRHLDPQGDVPSGESQRASDAPLNKRIEDRQDMLGATESDALGFSLTVAASLEGADSYPDDITVDVRWAPAEQTEDLDDWQVAQAKLAAGVPPATVLVEAGYAPETVDQWIRDTPAIELAPRVDLLVKIAAAAQGLGASAAMGVVDPGLVQQAIGALTGRDRSGVDA